MRKRKSIAAYRAKCKEKAAQKAYDAKHERATAWNAYKAKLVRLGKAGKGPSLGNNNIHYMYLKPEN